MTKRFETRLNRIADLAWTEWQGNDVGMDSETRDQTIKTARDAANNEFQDEMTDGEWLRATLRRLIGAHNMDVYG